LLGRAKGSISSLNQATVYRRRRQNPTPANAIAGTINWSRPLTIPARTSVASSSRQTKTRNPVEIRFGDCEAIENPLRAVNDRRHHEGVGRRVTAQLVGDQTPWRTALPFQQLPEEACGRMPIAPGLEEDVDHVAVLVHGPPPILLAPVNVYEQFV
jgi:hypothetical protein